MKNIDKDKKRSKAAKCNQRSSIKGFRHPQVIDLMGHIDLKTKNNKNKSNKSKEEKQTPFSCRHLLEKYNTRDSQHTPVKSPRSPGNIKQDTKDIHGSTVIKFEKKRASRNSFTKEN